MLKAFAACGVLFFLASAALAQIIYEPVRYEYRVPTADGREVTFYYAGNNPRVFENAERAAGLSQDRPGAREGRYGVGYLRCGLIGSPPYLVVSDAAPYLNAAVYGVTPTDVRNEAYARVPRYFTKAELVAAAAPAPEPQYYEKATVGGVPVNGSRVRIVPASGWPAPRPTAGVDIRTSRAGESKPTTGEPKPLLIIPKRLLEPAKHADSSVAVGQ